MDILPSGNIFRELQDIYDTGYFSSQVSIEDQWQQASEHLILICAPYKCMSRECADTACTNRLFGHELDADFGSTSTPALTANFIILSRRTQIFIFQWRWVSELWMFYAGADGDEWERERGRESKSSPPFVCIVNKCQNPRAPNCARTYTAAKGEKNKSHFRVVCLHWQHRSDVERRQMRVSLTTRADACIECMICVCVCVCQCLWYTWIRKPACLSHNNSSGEWTTAERKNRFSSLSFILYSIASHSR